MTNRFKLGLLAGSAALLIGFPVAANHDAVNLRGSFPAAYEGVDAQYVYSENQYPSGYYAHKQTVQQGPQQGYAYHVDTSPAYVASEMTSQGLRGLAGTHGVSYSKQSANNFHQDLGRHMQLGDVTIQTNPFHSDRMLDWQENTTGKSVSLLVNRANGILPDNSLTLGAGLKGGFMWQKTDTAGQFPLLSRFPFFSPGTDTESGVFAINNAAMAITGTFGDWTTIYLQPEYSETEFAGDQDELQLRKAFVVLGNLEKMPFYASFGRKTIDFGNFDSYNPFTHTEAQHYFWAASDNPVLELGYYKDGFKLSASAFSGGRQLRVAYADENNNIANYAVNAEKEFLLGSSKSFTMGGGYLHDTIYRNNWTAHTFQGINSGTPPANFIEYRNSAVTGFAEYNSNFLDAMLEYSTTLEPWAAAIPQAADGTPLAQYLIDPTGSTTDRDNINFDQNLEVLTAQVRVKPKLPNGKRVAISAVGSWGFIGDDFQGVSSLDPSGMTPTSWKKNQQHVLGVEYPISPYLDIGAEYVYNKGFIPFVNPQNVSNDDTEAHAINVGLKARF
ncbi:MAG: hypothetical protein HKN36_06105 [Hellea sp.]|nr:hypothetical protein [Hellea sp.]